MTLKEKAAVYVERNYDGIDVRLKNFIFVSFMDGYEQAKEEITESGDMVRKEELDETTAAYFRMREANRLKFEEITKLKDQIEKMRSCESCVYKSWIQNVSNGMPCNKCKGHSEWEFKE